MTDRQTEQFISSIIINPFQLIFLFNFPFPFQLMFSINVFAASHCFTLYIFNVALLYPHMLVRLDCNLAPFDGVVFQINKQMKGPISAP